MWPFFLWAPQWYLPWSGSVTQALDNALFKIPAAAGNEDVEREVANWMSYGHQLGLLTKVLLARERADTVPQDKAAAALEELVLAYGRIEQIKEHNLLGAKQRLIDDLHALRTHHPEVFDAVLHELGCAVTENPASGN